MDQNISCSQTGFEVLEYQVLTQPPFPRSIERGLIEAVCSSTAGSRPDAFPRSIERGLIEATGFPIRHPAHESTFRVRSNAASLKHELRKILLMLFVDFPRSIERGLIEAA